MKNKTQKHYQFPFFGGLLAGTGFGLWGFIFLAQVGVLNSIGHMGVIVIGFLLVFLGIAIGLPGRKKSTVQN
ncbi:MAG: hypothetical protein LAT83_11775 [Kiritimatiellae bacterium]|nr:hypothetical protein [Kiritimatiellia bacterium]